MKRYLPFAIAAAAPIVVVVALYVTAPAAQSTRTKVDYEIERNLATARRLLAAYEPGEQMLLAATDKLIGAGAVLEFNDARLNKLSEQWGDVSAKVSESPIKPMPESAKRDLAAARDAHRKLAGDDENGEPPLAGGASAVFSDVKSWLETNNKRLDEAARLIDAAINVRSEGEDNYSGREHPEANRLRAILAYHQAESLRRTALLKREEIDRLARRLLDLHGRQVAVSGDLKIAETMLAGGEWPALPAEQELDRNAAPEAAPAVEEPAAEPKGAAGREGPSKLWHGIFSRMRVAPPPAPKQAEAPKAAPEPAPETAPAARRPALPAVAVTPMATRIATYEEVKSEAQQRIEALGQKIQGLRGSISDLESRIASKRQEASGTDRKMVDMEKVGFSRENHNALHQQIAEYESLSRANRDAAREANLLEFGGYRNAKLVSADEDWHKAEIQPAVPQKALEAQKSLDAHRLELASAQATLEGDQKLVELLTAQIASLKAVQADIERRINGGGATTRPAIGGLKAQRDALRNEIEKIGAAMQESATLALKADDDAAEMLKVGIEAASRAQRAVNTRKNDARQPASDGAPNARIEMIAGEQWRIDDIDAMTADLRLLRGWVLYERSIWRRHLAGVFRLAKTCGLKCDPAAEQKAADEDAKTSLEDAKTAAEGYNDKISKNAFKNDWTLHVNAAGANYLLSKLTDGQPSREYRTRAAQEYQLATQGQETNPDRQPYVARLQALNRAKAAAPRK